jgi:uncharacterized protein (DUF1800 family)
MKIKSKYWLISVLIILVEILPGAAATPVNPKIIHLLNRLSFGASPRDIEKVESMGVDKYIQQQLSPDSIPEPQSLNNQLLQLETLRLSSQELAAEYRQITANNKKPTSEEIKARQQRMRQVQDEATQARLIRAIESPRQLQEVMVDFWYNHFNVYAGKGRTRLWVGTYERDAIRPIILGKFRNLLEATARHPAMLFYLDNWQNRRTGLNENYARELMELHTLGVDGGYTQQDVITLAKILTGWGLSRNQKQSDTGFYFDSKHHDFSDKVFLGHTIKGSGEAEVEEALDILSKHPATARHISYKLAQYFVSDNPPSSLVKKLQQRYLATDGNIREILITLFQSSEFWNAKNYNAKFKTPYQYVISAVRATGIQVNNTKPLANTLQQLGMPIFGCPTPDGYKNTEQVWLNPDAMTRRLSFAISLTSGRLTLLSNQPVDASQLINTIGNISPKTLTVINSKAPKLRSSLILGSPEFMRR